MRLLTIYCCIFLLLFSSCGLKKQIVENNLKPFAIKGKHKFHVNAYDGFIYNNKNLRTGRNPSLSELFDIPNVKGNTMTISILDYGNLQMDYVDSLGAKIKIFKGKFKRQGNYFIKIKERNINIPIIYSSRLMDKYNLFLLENGDLVIAFHHISEGNIFIFGAGSSYKTLYYYKKY